jgi:hypothetical protein
MSRLERQAATSSKMLTSCSCPTAIQKQHRSTYAVVLFAVLIPLCCVSWRYHTAHTPPNHAARPPSIGFKDFNPSAIEAYCNHTNWRPNLVFNLANANGGDMATCSIPLSSPSKPGSRAPQSCFLARPAAAGQTSPVNIWASCRGLRRSMVSDRRHLLPARK